MNLPKQERFTIEDVAARWNKPVSYVQDLNRRGLLMRNKGFIAHVSGSPPIKLTLYFTREDLEKFEREHQKSPVHLLSVKEYAAKHGISERTVFRLLKSKSLKGRRIGGQWRIPSS
jgi:excisionase family DNA binding protein